MTISPFARRPFLPYAAGTPPHSHSIVLIECNELILFAQNFICPKNFRRPDRQMRMAFDFKEKFDRSAISSLSRSIFLESAISTARPTWPKNYRQHLSLP
jgi:hypothetical protein